MRPIAGGATTAFWRGSGLSVEIEDKIPRFGEI